MEIIFMIVNILFVFSFVAKEMKKASSEDWYGGGRERYILIYMFAAFFGIANIFISIIEANVLMKILGGN